MGSNLTWEPQADGLFGVRIVVRMAIQISDIDIIH